MGETSCVPVSELQAIGADELDWHIASGCRWRELPVPSPGKDDLILLSRLDRPLDKLLLSNKN